MAEYPSLTLTLAGIEMIAESQATGTKLIITNAKIGDGTLAEGADIEAMTDIIASKLVAPLSNYDNLGNGELHVAFAISNSTVESGFFAREIGIFAMLEDGTEKLYAYANAGLKCDWIPSKSTPIDSQVVDARLVIGNAENVTVMVTDDAFALARDFLAHEVADNAHDNRFSQYLPLAGGKMTGSLVSRNVDNSYITLAGGTAYGAGGYLGLYGKDAGGNNSLEKPAKGAFFLEANDGTNKKILNGMPDGTLDWGGKPIVRSVNGVVADSAGNVDVNTFAVGDIKWSSADLTQVGFLVANGAEVGRATYPDLCAVYEAMGFPWGAGDGSTTFNLPNLIGKFAEGADSAGGYHEAGLPNIEGQFGGWNSTVPTGAFKLLSAGSNAQGTASWGYNKINFNASRSSSIYGNSTTVQPPSALLIPYVKAFAGASADSTDLAISEVANDVARLSGRVYLVESVVNDDGSWYRKYSDGWLEQGGNAGSLKGNNRKLITLLKPMADTNYTVLMTPRNVTNAGSTIGDGNISTCDDVTTTTFYAKYRSAGVATETSIVIWYACGMGAK